MAPRKRRIEEIGALSEPALTEVQREHLREGVELFNAGRYWHAHEAWEQAWLAMPEGPAGDAEIILRGLIQLAAAQHLLGDGRRDGAASNLRKAHEKLALAPSRYMGIEVAPLLRFIQDQRERLDPEARCEISAG